jgi:ABC-type polysaccharide/polyol phosphate export permease
VGRSLAIGGGPRVTTTARPRSSIWSSRSLIWNFAQRELKTRFKGTALGWAWSLMVPIATLLTYSLVFSVVFRATPPDFGTGRSGIFPVWLFAGLIPWSFFLITVNTSIPTLLANGPLLQKVYFPSYAPIVGSATAIGVQTVIEFTILAVVLTLLGVIGPSWLLVPAWFAIFATFVTAVAVSLAVVNVYFRDVAHVVNVALTLLFFLTPIIYTVDLVPVEWNGIPLRAIVSLNPIAGFVESFRSLMYGLEVPPPGTWLILIAWTAFALIAGVLVYRRWGLDIGETV